ncbi:hypothetical protein TIFTF001_040793 [Ficus carica]|uniref:Uncharacterized protein n=1 Tax=Ficus carica TaxID=3494 RepID=A0AA87Z5X0_FICCA|nr:hypothetical protein TIFTF001_040793 [Ficus carica]
MRPRRAPGAPRRAPGAPDLGCLAPPPDGRQAPRRGAPGAPQGHSNTNESAAATAAATTELAAAAWRRKWVLEKFRECEEK